MSVFDIHDFVVTKLAQHFFTLPFMSYSKVETTVIDNNDGSYAVSYTPREPGPYSMWVFVKAQHVKVITWFCSFFFFLNVWRQY